MVRIHCWRSRYMASCIHFFTSEEIGSSIMRIMCHRCDHPTVSSSLHCNSAPSRFSMLFFVIIYISGGSMGGVGYFTHLISEGNNNFDWSDIGSQADNEEPPVVDGNASVLVLQFIEDRVL